MELTRICGESVLRLHCADSLAAHGQWALSQIANLIEASGAFSGDLRVAFGWSSLTLKRSGKEIHVFEPDFDRDPGRDLREDVSATLEVQAEMLDLVRQVGCQAEFATFDQTILVPSTWKPAANFELQRVAVQPPDRSVSGWRVDAPDGSPATEQVLIAELLKRGRPILRALALPVGYSALFEHGRISTIGRPRRGPPL